MAGDILASLRVLLSADTAAFSTGMSKARREAATSAGAINKSLAGIKGGIVGAAGGIIAGLTIGALANLTKRGLDYAASLGETAQQLGVTTEALQVFRYAATQVGMSQQEVDTSLKKLSDSIAEAGRGSKAQATAFNELGVNVRTAGGELKSTDRVIREMADGFAKLKNPQDQVRIGMDLMGRSGSKMVPLLSGGAKGVDQLRDAAHRLGVVLSDKQIQNADKTADKLEDLKQILEARIAGAVSDNTTSILSFADALIQLVDAAGQTISWLDRLGSSLAIYSSQVDQFSPWPSMREAGRRNEAAAKEQFRQAAGRPWGSTPASGGVGWLDDNGGISIDIGAPSRMRSGGGAGASGLNRIAGGRKGGRGRSAESIAAEAERKRREALQQTYDRERELSDAKAEELRAQQALLTDYVDRSVISHQLIDIEADQRNKQIDLSVKLGETDAAAGEQLKAINENVRVLKKRADNQQVELDRQRDFNRLEDLGLDFQQQELSAKAALAETMAERRRVELEMLDIAYQQKQKDIDRLKASEDWADQEAARRMQFQMDRQRALDTAGVMRGTRGPLEEFQASLPSTAEKMNEALQSVAVNGLRALEDGIISVIDGTKSLVDAFRDMATQIIAELLRIQIQRAIFTLLGAVAGGGGLSKSSSAAGTGMLKGFATGGYTGDGPVSQIAGFAHRREFYFDAAATSRIGRHNLEALRNGRIVANDAGPPRRQAGDVHFHLSGVMTKQQSRETTGHLASASRQRLGTNARRGLAG